MHLVMIGVFVVGGLTASIHAYVLSYMGSVSKHGHDAFSR